MEWATPCSQRTPPSYTRVFAALVCGGRARALARAPMTAPLHIQPARNRAGFAPFNLAGFFLRATIINNNKFNLPHPTAGARACRRHRPSCSCAGAGEARVDDRLKANTY